MPETPIERRPHPFERWVDHLPTIIGSRRSSSSPPTTADDALVKRASLDATATWNGDSEADHDAAMILDWPVEESEEIVLPEMHLMLEDNNPIQLEMDALMLSVDLDEDADREAFPAVVDRAGHDLGEPVADAHRGG